jgi:hypothetical protein
VLRQSERFHCASTSKEDRPCHLAPRVGAVTSCMGPRLRCPEPGAALRSLATLFGVADDRFPPALRDAAALVDADADAELARAIVPALTEVLGHQPLAPSRIHFFHGTRAFEPELFARRGLLPLRAVLDYLWERMRSLAPEIPPKDFATLREGLDNGRIRALTYKHRVDTADDGPNGVLVRDVLLHPEAYASSKFVHIPEIVEDICIAARTEFDVELESRFEQATTRCIVEFAAEPRNVDAALAAACWYVEAALRGKTASGADALWNFDGDGIAVPPSDIVFVEKIAPR